MVDNPVERIKQIDKERALLVGDAKKEALARAERAIIDLNDLGFPYKLVEGNGASRLNSTRKGQASGTGAVKDAPCPVCEFKTKPLHDARRHRAQGKRKRAFTAQQLKEMGYVRA